MESIFNLIIIIKRIKLLERETGGEREIEARQMAVRIAIGAATKPPLFHHFRSAVNPTGGKSRLAFFTASASISSSPTPKKLILYSKPGCCLCDGLKEKLDAAFSLSGPKFIGDVELQVPLYISVFCFH